MWTRDATVATRRRRSTWPRPLGHLSALLAHGTDIEAPDINGRTPIHYATTPAAVRMLLARGAKPVALDVNGCTPAHAFAREARSRALAEWLRVPAAATADIINVQDDAGMTALHVAATTRRHWRGATPAVQMMLHHGADDTAVDCYGKTAVEYATARVLAMAGSLEICCRNAREEQRGCVYIFRGPRHGSDGRQSPRRCPACSLVAVALASAGTGSAVVGST